MRAPQVHVHSCAGRSRMPADRFRMRVLPALRDRRYNAVVRVRAPLYLRSQVLMRFDSRKGKSVSSMGSAGGMTLALGGAHSHHGLPLADRHEQSSM